MYALLDNNKVVGVEANKFELPDALTWAEIPAGADVRLGFIYSNAAFVDPDYANLELAQAAQERMLSAACQGVILSGFTSSALGSAYTYASSEVDQRNITQSAQCSKGGLLSCADAAGVWSRQPHTQAQSQQVLEDFVTARDGEREKLGSLVTQINAATTIEAVQAIVWA